MESLLSGVIQMVKNTDSNILIQMYLPMSRNYHGPPYSAQYFLQVYFVKKNVVVVMWWAWK